MSRRLSAVVICPGRGTYGKEELGYLGRWHGAKEGFFAVVDGWRRAHGRTPVRELDADVVHTAARHASSANASPLIYACALADLQDIDQDRFEIVAVTGNSLGWYLALAAAGALDAEGGIAVVDTMGALMEAQGAGGQLVYPLVDEAWRRNRAREDAVAAALAHAKAAGGRAFVSIKLGGMAVLAGDEAGIAALEGALPTVEGRFPARLARHSAFHTPLLAHVAREAAHALGPHLFKRPSVPLIDGRGVVHQPWSAEPAALHAYTFGDQITTTYDFSRCVEVAVKEFAPDRLIVLGPGTTMGPSIAQELIAHRWRGIDSKAAFQERQAREPFLLAMGLPAQRAIAARAGAAAR